MNSKTLKAGSLPAFFSVPCMITDVGKHSVSQLYFVLYLLNILFLELIAQKQFTVSSEIL